jgi:hypothetical protein
MILFNSGLFGNRFLEKPVCSESGMLRKDVQEKV